MYRLLKRGWPLLALAVLVAYPWIMSKPYYHGLGFNVLLYATMAVSWNIMGGYTGYKSLGHSAFYGLGAYLVAIAASRLGWNPLWSAPLLALAVAVVAMLLGWIMLRTHGSAFVIATIALLLIFRLLALRDDEGKAEMVGVNTTLYKVIAFGISAYFVGLGGGIWSYYQTHISPTFAFDILVGVEMILMTMLGGLGTLWGPVLGAFILIPASDLILFSFSTTIDLTPIHLTVRGALMLIIILFMPLGILPTIGDWLASRAAPRAAHAGARSMAELHVRHSAPHDLERQTAEDSTSMVERELP